MPNVSGTYDRKTVFTNLYLFVVAPPANGKGTLTYAQNLVRKLHDRFLAVSNKNLNEYKKAMSQYKAKVKDIKKRGVVNNGSITNAVGIIVLSGVVSFVMGTGIFIF